MNTADPVAHPARETKARKQTTKTAVTLHRHALVQVLETAADVMQNTAAVSASHAGYYRDLMKTYREAAHMIGRGARLTIKD